MAHRTLFLVKVQCDLDKQFLKLHYLKQIYSSTFLVEWSFYNCKMFFLISSHSSWIQVYYELTLIQNIPNFFWLVFARYIFFLLLGPYNLWYVSHKQYKLDLKNHWNKKINDNYCFTWLLIRFLFYLNYCCLSHLLCPFLSFFWINLLIFHCLSPSYTFTYCSFNSYTSY